MRKTIAVAGVFGALVLGAFASSASGARLVDRFHATFSYSFPGYFCGIPGSFNVSGMDNIQVFVDGTFKDESRQNQVFTSAVTGKQVLVFAAQQFVGKGPIYNGNGTVTFLSTYKGLPEKIKLANGRTLLRDAGNVTFRDTFDAATGEFLGRTVSPERGPHPDLDSNFTLACEVVVPAIS
jgi:hypothetical protein